MNSRILVYTFVACLAAVSGAASAKECLKGAAVGAVRFCD
jgi:hypothetical protein